MHRSTDGRRFPVIAAAFVLLVAHTSATAKDDAQKPNVVIIFLDDSGWGDFQPFGKPTFPTPYVEKLAKDGCRYDNFYVPQAICSASRAALMTGCYPGRTRVFGAHPPKARGLDPKFKTMAEVLKAAGYKTGFGGKWHLGDQPDTRPHVRGFDEAIGLMYSNDMWEFHPENPKFWGKFPLQFWRNGKVTIERVRHEEQKMLTTWFTEFAVDFIKRHREDPFFLYVPHPMPHVPLYVSKKFEGKSGAGLYGDVMMEIDWSVGQITKALADNGVEDRTLVVFTSDNGPWAVYGDHAGVTPFRESKATSFDGGVRSACVMKLPGKIPAGTRSTRAFSTIDLLPTIANLTGAKLPDYAIDGKDVWPLIRGDKDAKNPHRYYPFTIGGRLESILSGDGRWKLHLPHGYGSVAKLGKGGLPGKRRRGKIELSLFDLENDPYEKTDVRAANPEIAEKLEAFAEEHRNSFFSKPRKKK